MFNLFYFERGARLMCTFTHYSDCKKALDMLREKYSDAQIWYEKVETMDSFPEWFDKYYGKIEYYEKWGT
jgi:hypothetical protein